MKLPVYWVKPFYRDSEAPGQRGLIQVSPSSLPLINGGFLSPLHFFEGLK